MIEIPPMLLYIIVDFSISLIVTLSLNLEAGLLNLPQFGRLLTVLAGAIVAGAIPGRILAAMLGEPYGAEYAQHTYNYPLVYKINIYLSENPALSIGFLLLTLVLAAVLGGLIGYLCAYPAVRLREAYLGITLLAFGDVLMNIAWNYEPLVGGTTGVNVPDFFRFLGTARFSGAAFIILGIALIIFLIAERYFRSPFGRVLKAVRDAEVAASVYGKDIVKIRSQALVVGGAMAAVGGALWAIYTGSMKAVTYTRLTWTFWPWAFMMLGGTGNNIGVFLGVLTFVVVRTMIYVYKGVISAVLPIAPEWLEYILVGLVIVAIALFRPQGILPEKPLLSLPKEKIQKFLEGTSKEGSQT